MRKFSEFPSSMAGNCCLPLVNAGMVIVAISNPTQSLTTNILPAITTSPGSSFRKKQQCSERYLSLTQPPQAFDKNEIVPCGVMPIKNLIVLWCLYNDQVCDLASKFDGMSMKTSKQSMMMITGPSR